MNETIKIDIESEEYPELLRQIPDPPRSLYCRGNPDLLKTKAVSIVGSRKATDYGKWSAAKLSRHMVQNDVTVVSGMAMGIDSYAHRAALDEGGNTIAVLGNGVDICYPRSNAELYNEILKKGLVISESKDGEMPKRYSFPLRNRIISGIGQVTVIVEAGLKSGSLITAERAVDQGRPVYAVPGNINRNTSFGCNKLISEGAYIMISFDDALREMGIDLKCTEKEYKDISQVEKKIIGKLRGHGEMTVDDLCEKTGLAPSQITGLVTVLEIKGYVQTAYGKIFIEN